MEIELWRCEYLAPCRYPGCTAEAERARTLRRRALRAEVVSRRVICPALRAAHSNPPDASDRPFLYHPVPLRGSRLREGARNSSTASQSGRGPPSEGNKFSLISRSSAAS